MIQAVRIVVLRIAGLVLALMVVLSPTAFAQENATPTQYQFTVKQVDICTSVTCTDSQTLSTTETVFDIGSSAVAAGAVAGSIVAPFTLQTGKTFTHIRVTVDRRFSLTATAPTENNGNGNDCRTTGTVTTPATTTSGFARVDSDAALASTQLIVPDSFLNSSTNEIIDDDTMRLTVQLTAPFKSDTVPTFDIAFDVTDKITFQQVSATDCNATFGAPGITMSLQ